MPDEEITTAVDVAPYWADKLRALSAHASQGDAAALLRILSATASAASGRLVQVEQYVRAYPAPGPGQAPPPENDLFSRLAPAQAADGRGEAT